MKTYQVEFKYEAYALYEVSADTKEEAEDKAWLRLQDDDDGFPYGEWQPHSVSESSTEGK